ncbi:MAG: DNA-binding response OmpR family regulator [Rhodothermales bacterium]|jgi:DNA-binding response OmpR family regulator
MAVIICADDDPSMQALYRVTLTHRGHDVRVVPDGEKALTTFAERPADIVLLDVNMRPMGGIETCSELRKRPESFNVPILFVSGADSENEIVKGLDMGADDYITKPFRTEELAAKVEVALKRRSQDTKKLGLAPGCRFAGRYDLHRQIGSGGFSRVFEATDSQNDRQVALKVYELPANQRNDDEMRSRFLREAYEHSKLRHENIVRLLDFGHVAGMYFLAMEYIGGRSLKDVLAQHGSFSEKRLVQVGLAVAEALAHLDEHELIHRDVKLENILLSGDDVRLVDFGLTRRRTDETLSVNQEFHCSPAYASPEYVLGMDDLDIRSDIYSLAISLYQLATGAMPIPGDSIMRILENQVEFSPRPLRQARPDLGEPFCELIDRMLAKRRDSRPTIREVISGFRELST